MSHPPFPPVSKSLIRRCAPLAFGLLLVGHDLAAQSPDESNEDQRIERRVQVVFSDGEGVTEERLWIDSGDMSTMVDGEVGELVARGLFQPRSYLGVHLLDITPELREHFGATREFGVLVSGIAQDGPAAAAGVRVGDLLTEINGQEVAHSGQVMQRLASHEEGEIVTLGLVRERRSLSLEATLEARRRDEVDLAPIFWSSADGDRRVVRLPHRIVEIENVDLDRAFSELQRRLESPEWREKIEETTSRRLTLEKRILELENRLREMEKLLDEDQR